jgi:hypothetical protein
MVNALARDSVGSRYSSISRGASTAYRSCVKKLVMFVAAVFRIAAIPFRMLAAVVGCVRINHTMSATKRNQTILQNLTDNHPFHTGRRELRDDRE